MRSLNLWGSYNMAIVVSTQFCEGGKECQLVEILLEKRFM